MKAPPVITTTRLTLRRPELPDVDPIFARYSSDLDVTRYVGWPTHQSIDQTRAFVAFSDGEWERWPAGPYLIFLKDTGELLGGTGLAFETPERAMTGYVLAKDAWGRGYATECTRAMIDLARGCGVSELYAICHTDHAASSHVLEKCGFRLDRVLRQHSEFPNLKPGVSSDVSRFELRL